METKLWTRNELAEWLQVSVGTLKAWAEKGEIRPIYLGSSEQRRTGMRFTQTEVDRFLTARARRSTAAA